MRGSRGINTLLPLYAVECLHNA